MDQDLSRWLKDDLGMLQMSEMDLNTLMFHPRHGSLCRRLVKFLAESTLCYHRYPHVYASEEYTEATEDLEKANESLLEVLKNLDLYAKENENQERELVFLQSMSEQFRIIEELQRVSMEALKEMENRNNLGIEQVGQHIEEVDYLSKSSLESLYLLPDLNKVVSTIMTRQACTIDEDLNTVLSKVETIHSKINDSLASIDKRMDDIANLEPKLRKTSFQNLVALKKPDFEIVTIEANSDEKKLNDTNQELKEKVALLDQQVAQLRVVHSCKKNDLKIGYMNELNKYLGVLKELRVMKDTIS